MMPRLNDADHQQLMSLAELVVQHFTTSDWQLFGARTNTLDRINGHGRLLRSLGFGDDDYKGNAYSMLMSLVSEDASRLSVLRDMVYSQYGPPGLSISTAPSMSQPIVFTPNVFRVPLTGVENDLIAVMTPFAPEFEPVFNAITSAANSVGYRCLRVKDIWEESAIIQDVFSLIYRAHIVVCDFTGKNPNVFYEAGIAHTLGKHVIPITQSLFDVPFDLQHHRYLHYLNNGEGHSSLRDALNNRFSQLRAASSIF